MLEVEEIRRKLKDSNFTAVAKNSGVNYHILYGFMRGVDVRVSVIEKLTACLNGLDKVE